MDKLHDYSQILKQWTDHVNFNVIYSSTKHGYSSQQLNKCITGHSNVMLIIMTKNSIFGSYNGKRIPLKTEVHNIPTGYFVECDEDFFVFTLKSPSLKDPTLFVSNKHRQSLSIRPDNSTDLCVVGTVCCYWLYENRAFISEHFHSNFETHDGIVSDNKVFTGNSYPETFDVEQLLAVEWFD
ncbi:TLDc domain-containing protein [Entamoeba marina]